MSVSYSNPLQYKPRVPRTSHHLMLSSESRPSHHHALSGKFSPPSAFSSISAAFPALFSISSFGRVLEPLQNSESVSQCEHHRRNCEGIPLILVGDGLSNVFGIDVGWGLGVCVKGVSGGGVYGASQVCSHRVRRRELWRTWLLFLLC